MLMDMGRFDSFVCELHWDGTARDAELEIKHQLKTTMGLQSPIPLQRQAKLVSRMTEKLLETALKCKNLTVVSRCMRCVSMITIISLLSSTASWEHQFCQILTDGSCTCRAVKFSNKGYAQALGVFHII